MMPNHFTLVLAGAIAHFVTGWILNCEMLLGQFWKEKAEKNCGLSKDMRINLAAQFAASIALSIATCIAIFIFEKYQAPTIAKDALSRIFSIFFSPEHSDKNIMNAIHSVVFIWAGFIVPSSVGEVIWCGHDWKFWMMEMGSDLVGLVAIATTIAFLS